MRHMDQSLVTSGFDIELLIGQRYIAYILLSFTETGSFPLQVALGQSEAVIYQPSNVDRLYDPIPEAAPFIASEESFATEIIWGHPLGANIRTQIEVLAPGQFLTVFARFGLVNSVDALGRPINYRIRIEVLALEVTSGIHLALDLVPISGAELLAMVKERADRDVPLPFVGTAADVARIEMRQLPSLDGGPIAIGFYMNLRLRNGPETTSLLPDRGDVFATMNFLEPERDIAFAIRDGFLADFSAHQKFTFAQKDEGSGEYQYPLRRDLFDPKSDHIGNLFSVTINPGLDPNALYTGEISIVIRGEYFVDNFFDPDFTFTLTLVPTFNDGVVTWSHRTDLSAPLAAVLATLVLGLVGLVGYAITTGVVSDDLLDDEQRTQMTAFLQSLPLRVPVELLRWDPFYLTKHQIVARMDEWIVNSAGIAFTGRASLGMETEPVDHVVLRTEARNDSFEIERLEYRVRDYADHARTLDPSSVFAATDRLTWTPSPTDASLFGLTEAEILARFAAKKMVGRQDIIPIKVHIDDHKIFRILCITPREATEQIRFVEDNFKRAARLQIVATQGTTLREAARLELAMELGMQPSSAQLDDRFRQKVNTLVSLAFKPYRASAQFVFDLQQAIDNVIRLDMAPNDFGLLQRKGILTVLGYDLIERHNEVHRPGTVILYYRDRPDFDPRDNLMNKLKYAVDHRRMN